MPQDRKISTTDLRQKNRNMLYRYLYQAETPKTKQEIARALSLSLPTVTQNLTELLDAGLIAYAGFVDSSGGRRARTVETVPDAKIALGMELSTTQVQLAAIDLRGRVLAYRCADCRFADHGAYRSRLQGLMEDFLDDFSLDRSRLLGVGLTLPGVVNRKTGVIEVAPVLHIRDLEQSFLTEGIPYPVHVGNDASDAGFAECWSLGERKTLAYLFLGKGVGGAMVIGGKPYEGLNHRSAEFGHICLEPGGRSCSCGQQGCLEAYCSTARLSDDFGVSLEEFFLRLNRGDPVCEAVFRDYLEHLLRGVHTIRMMMDCDVVLGGSVAPMLEPWLDRLRDALGRRDPFSADGSYLHLGRWGAQASCVGAGLHFVSDFLRSI